VPTQSGRAGTVVRTAVVLVAVVAAIAVVAYVVLHGNLNQKPAPQASPAFAAGLADVVAALVDASQPVAMPDSLPACVQGKLDPADVDAISKLQVPNDANNLPDATLVSAFKHARGCDRAALVQSMSSQGNRFTELGVNSIDTENCVNGHFVDAMADANPTTTDQQIEQELDAAFQNCVSINAALKGILTKEVPQLSPDQVECVADQMSSGFSWTQFFAVANGDQAQGQALEQLTTSAVESCPH
jgi:hypothetical protein